MPHDRRKPNRPGSTPQHAEIAPSNLPQKGAKAVDRVHLENGFHRVERHKSEPVEAIEEGGYERLRRLGEWGGEEGG